MKKYELIKDDSIKVDGRTLYRIRALVDIRDDIPAGKIGGYIESEKNLSNNAWVYGNARVYGNAQVSGDAQVFGNAWVSGDARVYSNAYIKSSFDYSCVKGFGSTARDTTFYRTKENGVSVVCGCFYGTLQEFRNKVKETHGESKFAKEYLMIADLMEMHFKKE